MSLALEARLEPSRLWLALTPPLAVLLTVFVGAILFAALGKDPLASLEAFFISPITSRYGLGELAIKATPLVLIAVGLAIGFRAGIWNIGAEGQFTLGAIAAGGVALLFWGSENPMELPCMLLAGIAGGMLWAVPPAFLRVRFGVNEILVSLMLTYVATLLLAWLVYGPWKDPQGFNFPQSRMFDQAAAVPVILETTRLHAGVVIAVGAVILASILVNRTLKGFAIRTVGASPPAAAYAGFSMPRLVWFTFLLSGGLAGLAGTLEIAGPIGQLVPVISPGYGFTAIIVAFLGRLQPWGILLAALLLALSFIGGENAQIEVGMPRAVTGVFQGLLLFFLLATDVLIRYRLAWRRSPAPFA